MLYEIRTINDLLKVPADKRDVCLREIQYALALHELAHGVDSPHVGIEAINWTDDGDRSVQLQDDNGEEIVTMRIVPNEAPNTGGKP